MTTLVTVLISVTLSTLVFGMLAAPLRAVLTRACLDPNGVRFWERFTALMLYLAPLFVALALSMPPGVEGAAPVLSAVVPRAMSSTVFGLVIALGGVGLRLSTLIRALPPTTPRPADSATESWLERR
jgi:hypothetical protein